MNHLWNLNLPWTWLNPPKGQMNPPSGNSIKAVQQIQIREPPRRGGSLIWYISQGDRTGAGVNEAPGAPQSRDPACAAAQVDPFQVHRVVADCISFATTFLCFAVKSHLSLISSLLLSKAKPHGRSMPRRQLRHSAVLSFDFVLMASEV